MDRTDVAVIGAGAIGLACARELLRLGSGRVVVLEALPAPGQGSTSRANGGFRAQFSTRPNIAFSSFSIGELEALERRTGLLSMRQNGYLLLTETEQGERDLRIAHDLQRSLGVDTEWLSPADVGGMAPPTSASRISEPPRSTPATVSSTRRGWSWPFSGKPRSWVLGW